MGMKIPIMGKKLTSRTSRPPRAPRGSGIASALFSTTQPRVLGLLFGQPERSFFASQVIALAGGDTGAVQRELARLEAAGLVASRRVGTQKHYQADAQSPVFAELCSLVRKTVGPAEPLRVALAPIAQAIQLAFVFGSVAKKADSSDSDIDLLVVSDSLSYADVYPLLEDASRHLGRTVNPSIYTQADLARGRKTGGAFLKRVMAQPKLWVIGEEHDIAA